MPKTSACVWEALEFSSSGARRTRGAVATAVATLVSPRTGRVGPGRRPQGDRTHVSKAQPASGTQGRPRRGRATPEPVQDLPAPGQDRPANVWAVAQDADGHLHVVAAGLPTRSSTTRARPARTRVLSVETDEAVHALDTAGENDPMRGQQWALDQVPFEAAWSVDARPRASPSRSSTPACAAATRISRARCSPGIDYVDSRAATGAIDPDGHGTHVAGIIAAHVNNALGIAGAAPERKILPVRVLDANGSGVASNVAEGHHLGRRPRRPRDQPEPRRRPGARHRSRRSSTRTARARSCSRPPATTASAGNAPMYPAAYPEAIAVAAVDSNLSAPVVLATPAATSTSPRRASASCRRGARRPPRTRRRAERRWRRRTRRPKPRCIVSARTRRSSRPQRHADARVDRDATSAPGGVDPIFGHGLDQPARRVLARGRRTGGLRRQGQRLLDRQRRRPRARRTGTRTFYGDLARSRARRADRRRRPARANGKGYWLAGADGAVYSFGNAHYYGSMAGRRLNSPIVGMAATPNGHGLHPARRRRRHLHLRQRALLRVDRRHAPERAGCSTSR